MARAFPASLFLFLLPLAAACGEEDSFPSAGSAAIGPQTCGPEECGAEVLAADQAYPITIKLSDSQVFWGNYGDFDYESWYSGTEGTIYVAPKAGGNAYLIKDGIVGLTDIAVQGNDVYWTAFGPELFVPGVGDAEVGYDIVTRRDTARRSVMGLFPSSSPLVDTLGPSIGGGGVLYFADYSADAIYAVRIPANNRRGWAHEAWDADAAQLMIENAGGPVDTAADDSYMAWVSNLTGNIGIYKKGSVPEPNAIDGPSDAITAPFALALQGRYVYWIRNNVPGQEGQPGYVLRAEKDAPRTVTVLHTIDLMSPYALAVDNLHVYWVAIDYDGYGGKLLRTPVAGGTTVVIASDLAFPASIAVDSSSIFVAECGIEPRTGRILRFPKYSGR